MDADKLCGECFGLGFGTGTLAVFVTLWVCAMVVALVLDCVETNRANRAAAAVDGSTDAGASG